VKCDKKKKNLGLVYVVFLKWHLFA